ncbi:exported hypothetical protein [Candidatus Desulfosporosinus infrequens]|uniref:Uncharacterized protein n=1 Tax=Candidatus Desulfosporosinus infrequens TaxID=2043169 RepID=A0A2U3K190_9FIRM|nr:exported hypothetical protein [Candidatus Desulfosporosinus infrequens]
MLMLSSLFSSSSFCFCSNSFGVLDPVGSATEFPHPLLFPSPKPVPALTAFALLQIPKPLPFVTPRAIGPVPSPFGMFITPSLIIDYAFMVFIIYRFEHMSIINIFLFYFPTFNSSLTNHCHIHNE